MSPKRLEDLLGFLDQLSKKRLKSKKSNPCSCTALVDNASGDSQDSLSYLFWIWNKNLSRIVGETSKAIVQVLLQDYMSPSESKEQWKNIAQEFGDF